MAKLFEFFRLLQSLENKSGEIQDPTILKYFEFAYRRCIEWFGSPLDSEGPTQLTWWHRSLCLRLKYHHRYIIFLKKSEFFHGNCLNIGHETYHRVTYTRMDIRRQIWADEMLACMASYHLLKEYGMTSYADSYVDACLSHAPARLQVSILRQMPLRARRTDLFRTDSQFPGDFTNQVTKLGMALQELVGWARLCQIVHTTSLEEWVLQLPFGYQQYVRNVLDLPESSQITRQTSSHLLPETDENSIDWHYRFGCSHYWLGDYETAFKELHLSLQKNQSNPETHFACGRVLLATQDNENAAHALRQAMLLNKTELRYHYELGRSLLLLGVQKSKKECLHEALDEFQESIRLQPEFAKAHYMLGVTFHNLGQDNAANTTWEKVLSLGDEYVELWARKKLYGE